MIPFLVLLWGYWPIASLLDFLGSLGLETPRPGHAKGASRGEGPQHWLGPDWVRTGSVGSQNLWVRSRWKPKGTLPGPGEPWNSGAWSDQHISRSSSYGVVIHSLLGRLSFCGSQVQRFTSQSRAKVVAKLSNPYKSCSIFWDGGKHFYMYTYLQVPCGPGFSRFFDPTKVPRSPSNLWVMRESLPQTTCNWPLF